MKQFLLGILFVAMAATAHAASDRPEQITVAYFSGWPTPNLFSQLKNTYDAALGTRVNWVSYKSGYEMNEAMQSGEVQIAYSQIHVPFLLGVTAGLDLHMIGIAVAYSGNDNCLVRNDAGISRANVTALEGGKIATLVGSVSHYRLLKMLAHLKADSSKLEIVAVDNATAAADALRKGEVVMACAFGTALRSMEQIGSPLMSTAEQEAIGLRLFDVVTVTTDFMRQYPETVQTFMDVTEASNNQWKLKPDPMRAGIAQVAGMEQDAADDTLTGFSFPSMKQQKSDEWMGKAVIDYSKSIADFFVAHGRLKKSLPLSDYKEHITTRFLR